jgi:hypothetical protein
MMRGGNLGDLAAVQNDLDLFALGINVQSTGMPSPREDGEQLRNADIRCFAHERHVGKHPDVKTCAQQVVPELRSP